jgi:beta-lactamase superfamily II metal-dependent hydrolase
LLAWVSGVARVAAAVPLGDLTLVVFAVGLVALLTALLLHARPRVAATCAIGAAACMSISALLHPPDATGALLDTGEKDRLWRRGPYAVVVTDGRAPPGRLLAALRHHRVRTIDTLVVTGRAKAAGAAVGAVTSRLRVRAVLAPADRQYGTDGTPVVTLQEGVRARAGPITVRAVGPREARVQVGSASAADARPP